MRLHEEVTIPHQRRQDNLAGLRIRQRGILAQIMQRQKPGVQMLHRGAHAHRHELVDVVVPDVGSDVAPCVRVGLACSGFAVQGREEKSGRANLLEVSSSSWLVCTLAVLGTLLV